MKAYRGERETREPGNKTESYITCSKHGSNIVSPLNVLLVRSKSHREGLHKGMHSSSRIMDVTCPPHFLSLLRPRVDRLREWQHSFTMLKEALLEGYKER